MKYRDYLINRLAHDRSEALAYLQAAIELYRDKDDARAFVIAIRTFVASQEKNNADQRRTG